MQKIHLGTTGILVSRAGLGTVKLGRNQNIHYPSAFELPSDQEVLTLLNHACDLGINLLDTAPAYGISEERLGKLLKNQRHSWVICSKAGEEFQAGESTYDFSAKAIRQSVERSLRRLKTDYIDILLIHSNGDDEKIIVKDEALDTLNTLKKEGLIRASGMSTKTVAGGQLAVDLSDVVMVTYNPLHNEDKSVIDSAHQKNKGVLIKKALASGHLTKIAGEDPVQAAMNFVFTTQGVSSVILGTINQNHLHYNVQCIREITKGS